MSKIYKLKNYFTFKNSNLNEEGASLSTVIITAVLALAAVGAAIVIYNVIADNSDGFDEVLEVLDDLPPIATPQAPPIQVQQQPPPPQSVLVPRIVAGSEYSCSLTGETVQCWGVNGDGQLGDGTDTDSSTPVLVSGITTAEQVSGGGEVDHTCALLRGGTVQCWGVGDQGQLGDGTYDDSSTPVLVSGITTATQVSGGVGHTCALLTGGTVQCWGANYDGQLGDGTNTEPTTPVSVLNITTATQISAGNEHTCAVLGDDEATLDVDEAGTVQCWGAGGEGQLGDGEYYYPDTPVPVSKITTATQVSAGNEHTCAVLGDDEATLDVDEAGTVQCWGAGREGQLGDDRYDESGTPVPVSGITTATQVSAGFNHTCAVLEDGAVQCWGVGFEGQLGNGIYDESGTPVPVSGITTATQVSAGNGHTCAVLEDGAVQCWGVGSKGQLGNGETADSNIPVAVSPLTSPSPPPDPVPISASGVSAAQHHTCAVITDGTVECWGLNTSGQLGNEIYDESNIRIPVFSIATATQVSAGDIHTCALVADGTVQCWGFNKTGQLGNGSTATSHTPVLVSNITTATQVSAGSEHTCAVTGGTVWCWGANLSGQLGNGRASLSPSKTPMMVSGISTATQVSAGNEHTCAVTGGTVQCWGTGGSGRLGNDANTNSRTPVPVSGITTATQVSAGTNHTCAVLGDDEATLDVDEAGTVQCWGDNGDGQLGDGTNTGSTTPVPVSEITTATQVSAGTNHTCAVLADGTIQCWGRGVEGQLGDDENTGSPAPVLVSNITTATQVSAGANYTCAVLEDNTIQCWGLNTFGQLGDGTNTGSTIPVSVSKTEP